jgi:ABC-type nitrate/sulfonate/bicarbonate transport system permease component
VGRTPGDIFRAIFTSETAAETRRELFDASFITLRDAFFGLAAGLIVAVVAAISFNMVRSIEQTVMPVAMVLQSVPLVALTPVVALILGRGLATTTVLAGIVTFFPALVNVNLALRGAPKASMDLMRAYGANKWTTLVKVQLPCALPALFASLRIAAPLAIIGALLAEWLATAEGLGYVMLKSQTGFSYDTLWAAGALITMFSVILYNIISGLEGVVLAKYAPDSLAARKS